MVPTGREPLTSEWIQEICIEEIYHIYLSLKAKDLTYEPTFNNFKQIASWEKKNTYSIIFFWIILENIVEWCQNFIHSLYISYTRI